ncbi:ring-opening amidohydrolase [Rhodovulum sp. DZ06]|uniref:cyanuric acid amidohydrolase n=1 Tax=Rhodovulum sp. DZ06 TaxID=3425126 RepID=UPI003D358154
MTRRAAVHRLPMSGPDDVSAIAALIARGALRPGGIRAILGKTEGNGCVNDFTRGFAVQSLCAMLGRHVTGDALARIPMVMSGGTEGGLSPHWIVLEEREDEVPAPSGPAPSEPALAFASVVTRDLHPSEIGRRAQGDLVREAVLSAMAAAGIDDPADVHFVQIKCPLLTAGRAAAAGGDVATDSMLKSMGLSRGASALGVALALGEIAEFADADVGKSLDLWSSRASCSAGIELMGCEVVVLGLSPLWSGPLRIGHEVMQDAIDAPAIARLLGRAAPGAPLQGAGDRAVALLCKAEASASGLIRGARHTMLEDSDISSTRHARGFVGGMIAGLTGLTELFVSGGAEHQGPDGGGPAALIYDTAAKGPTE